MESLAADKWKWIAIMWLMVDITVNSALHRGSWISTLSDVQQRNLSGRVLFNVQHSINIHELEILEKRLNM